MNGGFRGFIQNEPVYVEQSPHLLTLSPESAKDHAKRFFRFDDPIDAITGRWRDDPFLSEAVRRFEGLRLIKQDPWMCTAGFILSSVSNIPKIESTLEKLMRYSGHRFPSPAQVAEFSEKTLREFGMGFRAKYLRAVAKEITNGFPLQKLQEVAYEDAKAALIKLPGIGEKVADCILLFGLGHLEAFPVDVWMQRIVDTYYLKGRKKTPKYVSAWGRNRFGPDAGYAQQYLYTYGRLLLDRQSPFREILAEKL